MMRWDATNRARGAISQPHFVQIVSFVAGFITIILIECIFVVAENEPSLSFFRESFLDFSSHSGRVFSRSQLSSRRGRLSCAPYLSLSLSLSLTFYLSSLFLSLFISPVLQSHSACIMYTHIPVVHPSRSYFLLASFNRVAEVTRRKPTSFQPFPSSKFGSA